MKVAKTRHVFSNKGVQWAITGFIYLAFFAFFIWYHDVRGKPFTLFTTEKCTAIASVYCLGLALAFGPLSRFFSSFDKPLSPGSFPTMVACLVPLLLKVVDLIVHGDSCALKPGEHESAE